MKTLFFFGLLLCFRLQPVFTQSLHVEGDAIIRGRMELFNATGDSSIFIGVKAGMNDDGDNQNTFIGHRVGIANSSGKLNVYIGEEAGEKNVNGSANAFIGFQSGQDNIDGAQNVFLGFKAGQRNTSGRSNVFVGYETGKNNSMGSSNTFLGSGAGLVNEGSGNVLIGRDAGASNGSGAANVFVGRQSGNRNETGNDNVYVGNGAGFHNLSGKENTLIGRSAGSQMTGGSLNTYIGSYAGEIDSTGFNNAFIGAYAGYQARGDNNVFLGYQAGFFEEGSNKLFIENSTSDVPLIYGDFSANRVGINRISTTNALEVQGTASKTTAGDWLANSDRRIKSDIKDIQNAREIIIRLRPVSFRYSGEWRLRNPSIEDRVYYNFIAQEYLEVFPHAVKGSGEFLDEDPEEILQIDSYDAQIVTIKAVQELILENQMLREEIRLLREIFTEFKSASSATKAQIKFRDQESN